MKRLHVHISVDDLEQSIGFYSSLFGAAPSVLKADYAKWLLDDPRVNLALSRKGDRPAGLDHLGIQTETAEELHEVHDRLSAAARPTVEERDAACCYARSDKHWLRDPGGVAWEVFHTHGELAVYGENRHDPLDRGAAAMRQPCGCGQLCGCAR